MTTMTTTNTTMTTTTISPSKTTPARGEAEESRGDLISFYNRVFVPASKSHASGIVKSGPNDDKLAQLPTTHPLNIPGAQASRRLTEQESVFVSPRADGAGCP